MSTPTRWALCLITVIKRKEILKLVNPKGTPSGVLLLQTKFLLQSESALRILLFEVFHMSLAVCHHGQKSSARVVVLRIRLQVLRKFFDALRQYGNLHLGRAGITVVKGYFLDELNLLGLGNHTTIISRSDPLCKPNFLCQDGRRNKEGGNSL